MRQFSFKDDNGNPVFIDDFGSDDEFLIEVGDKTIKFEWSELFGPAPLGRKSQIIDLPPRHPFWRAASLWNLQGRRLEGKQAIWHEPKKPVLKHLGGRNYLVIEDGEEGHDW